MAEDFIAKYGDARLPRYTSYPTAPNFSKEFDAAQYVTWLRDIDADAPSSVYLHIPFCRSMCWYCGCHTTITERDKPILDYLEVLHREIDLVAATRKHPLSISEIHFGGGTPTIIAPDEFIALMVALKERLGFARELNTSVEIDPRTLTSEMAAALGEAGVTRASLGVQSFDPLVQKAINRIQTQETTLASVEELRKNGIQAINFDLIYGLPHQSIASCVDTVKAAVSMRPDRFAVFGYAHVPDFKKHQRLIDERVLPDAQERALQADAIAEALVQAGYERIGMDHYSLPGDELAVAQRERRLHRNFQGYTTDACETLIGLGASSIGRFVNGYAQNEVPPGLYASRVAGGELPIAKGYNVSNEDRLRGAIIERLMCDYEVDIDALATTFGLDPRALQVNTELIDQLCHDGLIERVDQRIKVSQSHRYIVRSVASAFDAYLGAAGRTFSKVA